MRYFVGFLAGCALAIPLTNGITLGAVEAEKTRLNARHDSLDVELIVECRRGMDAGVKYWHIVEAMTS